MGIFDKGFDPLKEIQKVSKTAGEVVTRIAEGASGMAVAAGAAIVGAAVAGAASNAKAVVNKITATCRKRKAVRRWRKGCLWNRGRFRFISCLR